MTNQMENFFDSREAASIAAAERIAAALARRLDAQGEASVVVSGGTSPAGVFAELARTPLAWPDVHVILSDERWVPPDHADSNEKLVRETLLAGAAKEATVLPVYKPGVTIEERCGELNDELRLAPFPFACALLGMGEDGHFASLFPDAENLEDGLDVDSSELSIAVNTAASPHPRVSLTLSALSRSDEILLLMFGDRKREVYEAAKQTANGYPVFHLLRQKRAPVYVYWAP
ncbi:MAG TPA: 6-phosphogluconolactonase [Woeseiaceae bacterium]|nr:6-phosphogluconolactonase [Woeseiaceae bacterium]